MKSQVSLEYIILIGIILIAFIPIIYFSTTKLSDTRIYEANDAVNTLADAANSVCSLGPGSKDYVWITLPKGTKSSLIYGKEIIIVTSKYGDVYSKSKCNITGDVPNNAGTYKIAVETLASGIVNIGAISETCGDGICGYNENCACADCENELDSCQTNQLCCSGSCKNICTTGSCNDGNACTQDSCLNPGACSASCSYTQITQCISGDGCCPANCNGCLDSDCSGQACKPTQCDFYLFCANYTSTCSTGYCCAGECSNLVDSCPDMCVKLAYSAGNCDSSSSCPHTDNGVYRSEGDTYCTGGPQADTCCCVP